MDNIDITKYDPPPPVEYDDETNLNAYEGNWRNLVFDMQGDSHLGKFVYPTETAAYEGYCKALKKLKTGNPDTHIAVITDYKIVLDLSACTIRGKSRVRQLSFVIQIPFKDLKGANS